MHPPKIRSTSTCFRTVLLWGALLLAACKGDQAREAAADAATAEASTSYPRVVPTSQPYSSKPGHVGTVIFRNTFDHAVSLAYDKQPEGQQCGGEAGQQLFTLGPNAAIEVPAQAGEKLCYSMGKDLARPLVYGICEARSGDRIALAFFAGCYRR